MRRRIAIPLLVAMSAAAIAGIQLSTGSYELSGGGITGTFAVPQTQPPGGPHTFTYFDEARQAWTILFFYWADGEYVSPSSGTLEFTDGDGDPSDGTVKHTSTTGAVTVGTFTRL